VQAPKGKAKAAKPGAAGGDGKTIEETYQKLSQVGFCSCAGCTCRRLGAELRRWKTAMPWVLMGSI